MTNSKIPGISAEAALSGIAAVSAAAFAVLSSKTREPRNVLGDLKLRNRLPAYSRGTKEAVTPFGYLGKEWSVLSAAGLLGTKLAIDGSIPGAAAVVASTLGGIAASHIFDAVLPQRTPPPGRRAPFDPHFPSGHALHSASLIGTSAWVLSREGKGDRRIIVAAAAALTAALGVDRLLQDRHWSSDVAGGWLAALTITALASAGYEVAMKRGPAKKGRARTPHRPARKGKR
ncbi:MAG TPA: phosphatase PAP2 family protein [Gemmatimonadaceae bacterium]|nr:phosphatase PAP2 family protein [Gemmatimonadaceae bacterium]